jgi:hypothetical protein
MLWVMKGLDWRLHTKIVSWREVLEAMLDQREVVHPKEPIILEQLCLLLVLTHEILRIIVVSVTGLHHSLDLVSVAIVWHHEVVGVYLIIYNSVMLSNHVLLLLYDSLMRVIIPVRVLHVGIHAHRVLRRSRERLTMMVVHSKLVDELLRPLLVGLLLQVVLVVMKQAGNRLQVSILHLLPLKHHVRILVKVVQNVLVFLGSARWQRKISLVHPLLAVFVDLWPDVFIRLGCNFWRILKTGI